VTEQLLRDLKGLAGASTADLVGIAPGEAFTAEELGELGRSFGPVGSVIVLAQHIMDPVQMARFESSAGPRVDTCLADATLLDACWRAVLVIREAGFRAAVPRGLRYAASDPEHSISFKKAGVLAGFGRLGKSQLLIHPEWGPWMRLRAVMTDAPLLPDQPVSFSPCGDCHRCIDACPASALSERGIELDLCYQTVGSRGVPGSPVIGLSPRGKINCEECMRACPIGEAPPRIAMKDRDR